MAHNLMIMVIVIIITIVINITIKVIIGVIILGVINITHSFFLSLSKLQFHLFLCSIKGGSLTQGVTFFLGP